jgi:hypothetical protein
MAFLDRFRSKPEWKHSDPGVRASAVRRLGAEARETIADLAKNDPSAPVRRAAVRKLDDVSLLAELAQADTDGSVREEAFTALVAGACGEVDAVPADAAFAALSDTRHLSEVVRRAKQAAIRAKALALISDPKVLSTLARTAEDPETRLAALARVGEPSALAMIARSEHREVALAALERVADPKALAGIAHHAKHKAVVRRARALLDAQAPQPETAPAQASVAHESICSRLEALVGSGGGANPEQAALEAEREWDALAEAPGEGLTERLRAAVLALRAIAEGRAVEADEARRAQSQAERAIADRVAICAAVEALAPAAPPAELEALTASWLALVEGGPEAASIAARFERSAATWREARTRWEAAEPERRRAEDLAGQAERLADGKDSAEAKEAWAELAKAWSQLRDAAEVDAVRRFEAARLRLGERERTARGAREAKAQQNRTRLFAMCERLEALAKAESLSLKDATRLLRDVKTALEEPGPLPSKQDRPEILSRLKAARALVAPRIQDLRETDDWKRWANAGVQEELCKEVESLLELQNLGEAARQLHDLELRWKEVAEAPREQSGALWQRFKAARDQVRARCEEHFARLAQERSENLRRKEALSERAEALRESTDWGKTAEAIEALRAEWKTVGAVPRAQSEAVWDRFRKACDAFFARRKAHFDSRADEWAGNLRKKEELCARAEALAESEDVTAASEASKRLQAEWKKIGPVRKSKSEAVWQRFRAACDKLFDRYKRRDETRLAEITARREALCAELESFAPPADGAPGPAPPDDLGQRVGAVQAKWRQADELPRDVAAALDARLARAVETLIQAFPAAFAGSDLDPEANRQKRERLCQEIELLADQIAAAEASSPAATLVERWREALAANTMGARTEPGKTGRTVREEVEAARTAWTRVGPVPGETGRALAARFEAACDRALAGRKRGQGRPEPPQPPEPPTETP